MLLLLDLRFGYLFEPLRKLKIVLKFSSNKLVNGHHLVDAQLGEAVLQTLEVLHVFMLKFRGEFDLLQFDCV